jgi:glucokinase
VRGGLTAAELVATAGAGTGTAAADDDDEPVQKVVVERALANTDALCTAALDMVLRAWAAECRNVALRVMPYGGLYLAGGLTPKLLAKIKTVLTAEYTDGDPLMKDVIRTFPLYACMNEHVGLLGARVRAVRML